MIIHFQQHLRDTGSDVIKALEQKGSLKMNPLQLAAHFESTEALPVLLRHLQMLWHQPNADKAKIGKIVHSKATAEDRKGESSLIFNVMTNKNLMKSENLLAEFECKIHNGKSVEIQEYVFQHMGSGKESEETIEKIKKFHSKKLNWNDDWWPLLKLVVKILILQSLVKMAPITIDVATDTNLLVDYSSDNNTMQYNTTLTSTIDDYSGENNTIQYNTTITSGMDYPSQGKSEL